MGRVENTRDQIYFPGMNSDDDRKLYYVGCMNVNDNVNYQLLKDPTCAIEMIFCQLCDG